MVNKKGYVFYLIPVFLLCISLHVMMPSDAGAQPEGFDDKGEITPFSFMIGMYKRYISPIDGDRCPMYPSCSSFAEQAVREKGLTGIFLSFDRLLRCGRDLKEYPLVFIDRRPLHYDPVT